jgi:ABC-type amino acid transport substrate-binding protein
VTLAARRATLAAVLACFVGAAAMPAQAQPTTAPASAAAAPAVTDTIAQLRRRGSIVIGHREAALPFSYLVEAQPRGYAIDLCMQVVEGLKRRLALPALKVEWVQLQAAERVPAVVSGRVDLECGNTTATADRRKLVAFSTPTFIAGAGVLVRSDVAGPAAGAFTLLGLRGKRVVVASGTTGEKIVSRANEALHGLLPVLVKDNAEAFAALESGKAEAWITDDVLLAAYRAQSADPSRYVLLDKRHTIEPLALMHRKGDAAFERAVDAEVAQLFRSGLVQLLYKRWFQQPVPPRNISLELPPSRLLKEIFRTPLKMQHEVDIIVL